MRKLLIVTIENDLHALIIAQQLRVTQNWRVFVLEAERFATEYLVNFDLQTASILHREWDEELILESLDYIWWRRFKADQRLDDPYPEAAHVDLINNDCKATLRGVLAAHFHGTWISDPSATEAASFKPFQLRAAHDVGLLIPRTLISSDPTKVREFVHNGAAQKIIKPIVGTKERILFTQAIHDIDSVSDEIISSCPAIYQECIEGNTHLRIAIFGDLIHCTEIYSTELDWRGNLNEGLRTRELPIDISEKLTALLKVLNLQMGIVDMKVSSAGEYFFFEINPQGQFLFVQGITGADLAGMFCRFLERLDANYMSRKIA